MTKPHEAAQREVSENKEQNKTIITDRLIPSGILAPSAHNTQPWHFIVFDKHIDITVNQDKHLGVSDPTKRQLFISIGCAIKNLEIAARHFSHAATIEYFPDGTGDDKPVARLALRPNQKSINDQVDQLFLAIEQRHTDRTLYDTKPLSKAEVAQIPSSKLSEVRFVTERTMIDSLADLTEQATYATLSRPDFKHELSKWVRHNWTRQSHGMPGYAMGIPAPISLLGSTMVKFAPIHKQEAPKTKQQLQSASAVAIFTTTQDSPEHWMQAGQNLQQVWLEVTAAGLAAMPQVAAIEATEDIRKNLKNTLKLGDLPQSILRIGHSSQASYRATPRHQVNEIVTRK